MPSAAEHGMRRVERGLGGPVSAVPGARADRGGRVDAVLAEQGVNPQQVERAAADRPDIADRIARPPRAFPAFVRALQEGEIIGGMNAQERRLAMIDYRLGRPDRIKDRAGAAGMLGVGHPAAIVQLLLWRVRELMGIEEEAHGHAFACADRPRKVRMTLNAGTRQATRSSSASGAHVRCASQQKLTSRSCV
jgi:hypothetical protein